MTKKDIKARLLTKEVLILLAALLLLGLVAAGAGQIRIW
jgi:hypothetical protein